MLVTVTITTPTDVLTIQLNTLLQTIGLPFVLQSPTDLTPSLLLAILESILHVRIPFERGEHIQTIKVFLGILETDVLKTDVGLSRIDPRLLAIGSRDEVVYVAEVLCWVGQELGLLPSSPVLSNDLDNTEDTSCIIPPTLSLGLTSSHSISQTALRDQMHLVSPSSTITFLPPFTDSSPPTTSTLLFSTEPNDTQTNLSSPPVTSPPHATSYPQTAAVFSIPPPRLTSPSPAPPHAIIPPDDSSFTRQTPPIRRSGYISLVDHESELSDFYSHSHSFTSHSSASQRQPMFSTSLPPNCRKPSTTSRRSSAHADGDDDEGSPEPDWRDLLSQAHEYEPRRA